MMASHLSGERVLASLLLFVFVALLTISWRIAKHQQATALDGAAVHDNRELFSGEWAIESLHQCSPRPLREDFSSWNRSTYEVQHCPAQDGRGAAYHFVLLNSTHFLNNICDRNNGHCHLPTEKSSECSTDFYALDEYPRVLRSEEVEYPNQKPRAKMQLYGRHFRLTHDALILHNCTASVEWTIFHLRRTPTPPSRMSLSRREAALALSGVFGTAFQPASRKGGRGDVYTTDHVTLIMIDAISRAHFMRTFPKTQACVESKRRVRESYVLGGFIATGKFTMLAMTAFQIGYFNPLTPLMEFATEDGRTRGLAQYAREAGMISAICSGIEGFNLMAHNWKDGQLGPHHYLNALEDRVRGLSEIHEGKTVLECTGNLRQEEYCFPVGKSVAMAYQKEKGVRLFQQLYMTGNHQGDQLYGFGWDDDLVEYLKWQDNFYSQLGQRHTTIIMSDHGNQWASHKAAANERYSPLAIISSNKEFPSHVHQVLSHNELALITSVDLHNAVLGLMDESILPVNCRWESTNCDVSIRNIFTRKVHHRTPQQLGIPTK
ncbi:hypothetical protein FOZ63_023963 [Perkinsus olseni]|uniref:Uncharacterized protein n=1 Tax=Perkinsus olseni TaxID=32597 RepID=A0A7J6U395_PEROL|nr:hypothetical protein FOZ63_023963 [Perkinsus olseni]